MLKNLARHVSAFDGQVTLSLLPFHTLGVDMALTELSRVYPQFEYVNKRTGAKQNDEPRGWDDKMAQIERLSDKPEAMAQIAEQYEWSRTRLWRNAHDCYAVILPLVVDVQFENVTSPHVMAFQDYWDKRTSNVAEDFARFMQSMSVEMHTALWVAYGETRDNKLAAPDPNAEGSGGNTATSTGAA